MYDTTAFVGKPGLSGLQDSGTGYAGLVIKAKTGEFFTFEHSREVATSESQDGAESEKRVLQHTTPLSGARSDAALMWRVEQGELKGLIFASGHYRPDAREVFATLERFPKEVLPQVLVQTPYHGCLGELLKTLRLNAETLLAGLPREQFIRKNSEFFDSWFRALDWERLAPVKSEEFSSWLEGYLKSSAADVLALVKESESSLLAMKGKTHGEKSVPGAEKNKEERLTTLAPWPFTSESSTLKPLLEGNSELTQIFADGDNRFASQREQRTKRLDEALASADVLMAMPWEKENPSVVFSAARFLYNVYYVYSSTPASLCPLTGKHPAMLKLDHLRQKIEAFGHVAGDSERLLQIASTFSFHEPFKPDVLTTFQKEVANFAKKLCFLETGSHLLELYTHTLYWTGREFFHRKPKDSKAVLTEPLLQIRDQGFLKLQLAAAIGDWLSHNAFNPGQFGKPSEHVPMIVMLVRRSGLIGMSLEFGKREYFDWALTQYVDLLNDGHSYSDYGVLKMQTADAFHAAACLANISRLLGERASLHGESEKSRADLLLAYRTGLAGTLAHTVAELKLDLASIKEQSEYTDMMVAYDLLLGHLASNDHAEIKLRAGLTKSKEVIKLSGDRILGQKEYLAALSKLNLPDRQEILQMSDRLASTQGIEVHRSDALHMLSDNDLRLWENLQETGYGLPFFVSGMLASNM